MSKNYGIQYVGILIKLNELETYCNREEIDPTTLIFEDEQLLEIGDISGSAYSIVKNYEEELNLDDFEALAELKKYPSLIVQAYGSIDEIIGELKERYGVYLETDFPYRERLVHLIGSVYC